MFALGVTDPNTLWDIGDAQKMWCAGAELTGSDPSTATWTYPMRDHLGTPRSNYGQTRNLLSKNEYSPYGIPEVSLGLPSPIGYTGHYHDTETGLNYAPYRYYDPNTTRWLKRDPLGMIDGPNKYAYVGNSPLKRIDPLGGHWTSWVPFDLSLTFGAILGFGKTTLTCCDEDGCKHKATFKKICFGALLGISVASHVINCATMPGKDCPNGYAGWFREYGVSSGGGFGISTEFSETMEGVGASAGIGSPITVAFCKYTLTEDTIVGSCK